MKLLPLLLLLLAACDDSTESPDRTVYDIIPQGVIQADWTQAQKNCAAGVLAYLVRWAECSSVPEEPLSQLEDDGASTIDVACIRNNYGNDPRCWDVYANGSCGDIIDEACDFWASDEGRTPGER